MSDRYDEEVRRLAEVLATVLRVGNRTRQSVEEQLGMSSGYLSKILSGTVELRVRHILAILEAAGMEPGSFFELAYPGARQAWGKSEEDRRLIESTRAALGQRPPREDSDADFDDRVKRSLLRLLGLQAGGSLARDSGEPEAGSAPSSGGPVAPAS
jgi:hypothetical protein